MDILDWVIIGLVLIAALHGWRVGAAVQILSFAGVIVGLFIGVALVTEIAPHVHGDLDRTLASLLLLVVPCAVCGGIGRRLGVRLWGRMQGRALGRIDAITGTAIAMAGTVVFVWLLASVLVSTPVTSISSEIEDSAILDHISSVMPPIPSALSSIEHLLNADGFPVVLETGPLSPVKLPSSPRLRAAVVAAGRSTVQVTAFGCDGGALVDKGSGFVVAPGLVATNAHVVAGSNHVVVADEVGDHLATPIYFNPRYDLAILRVSGLSDPVLRLDPAYVGRGTEAAVLGYPGGGPFNAEPAGVLALLNATGYDIYGTTLVSREMYEIESLVRPGNSGGPLVEPDGTVIGIVFSRESGNAHIGYALSSPGVLRRLRTAERASSSRSVKTGACLAS